MGSVDRAVKLKDSLQSRGNDYEVRGDDTQHTVLRPSPALDICRGMLKLLPGHSSCFHRLPSEALQKRHRSVSDLTTPGVRRPQVLKSQHPKATYRGPTHGRSYRCH